MMNIGDLLRFILGRLDELWVTCLTGRRVILQANNKQPFAIVSQDVGFRGEYVEPLFKTTNEFEVKHPDELEISAPYHRTCRKLGRFPPIGGLLWAAEKKWVIVEVYVADSKWRGRSRIVLAARRFEDPVVRGV
jgi:hypothetical protein